MIWALSIELKTPVSGILFQNEDVLLDVQDLVWQCLCSVAEARTGAALQLLALKAQAVPGSSRLMWRCCV